MEVASVSRRSAERGPIDYVVGLPAEQRRAVTDIPKTELLTQVQALSGCHRCGFVEQVLAAFDPGFANGSTGPSSATGLDSSRPGGATSGGQLSLLQPSRLVALLNSHGGAGELVTLLQFNWRGNASAHGGPGAAAQGGDIRGADGNGGGGGGSGGAAAPCVELSDTLIAKPRLLRRFLEESVGIMQALSEEVGDCRRHTGCPGPQELSSTLARLDMQRTHTLERLAAWGVLRAPPPPHHQQPAQSPLPSPHGAELQSAGQPVERMSSSLAQGFRDGMEGGAGAGGQGSGASRADGDDGEELDLELSLAVQLSMQGAEQAGAGPMPGGQELQSTAGGDVEIRAGEAARQPHEQADQRTPPRQQPSRDEAAPTGPGPGFHRVGSPCPRPGPRGPPLAVNEVLGAAAGLDDATALLDAAAVAGLPDGLRERVEHLLGQLVQVQQRRGRLEAAAQHGILAAARKLLLLMLQLMWAGVRTSYRAWLAASSPIAPSPALRGHHEDHADGPCPPQPTSPTPGGLNRATPAGPLGRSTPAGSPGPVACPSADPPTPPSASRPAAAAGRSRSFTSRVEAAGEAAGVQPGAVRGVSRSSSGQAVQAPAARRSLSSPVGSAGARGSSHAALAAEGGLSPHRPGEGQQEETQLGTASPAAAAFAGGRRPRYHGLLAQLAEGLSEADTTLEDPTLGPVSSEQEDLGLSVLDALFDEVLASADEAMGGEVGGGPGSGASDQREESGSVVDRRARELFPGPSQQAAAAGDAAGGGVVAASREQDDPHAGTVSEGAGDRSSWLGNQAVGRRQGSWAQQGGGGAAAGARGVESGALLRASWQPGQQAPHGLEGGRRNGPLLHGGVLLRSSLNASATVASSLAGALGTGPSGGFDAAVSTPPGRGNAVYDTARAGGLLQAVARDTRSAVAVDGSDFAAAGASGADPRRDPHARRSLQALQSCVRLAAAGLGGCAGPEPASGRGGEGPAADGPCVRTDCRMRRVLQAQQLRNLQSQLSRCQEAQAQLQGEVGQLLDSLAATRAAHEQSQAALRRELALWQGEPAALGALGGAEELAALAAKLEGALGRVRAAQLQAVAERDLLCPVCWEARKGLVFQCGHQTCGACGERLTACPICRVPISIRIKTYG